MPTMGNATLGRSAGVSGTAVGIGYFGGRGCGAFLSMAEFNAIRASWNISKFTGRVSLHGIEAG